MREVISTGKTVDEATENACKQLGLSRDEVSVEILEMPVRKFFKTLPAKVCVRVINAEQDQDNSFVEANTIQDDTHKKSQELENEKAKNEVKKVEQKSRKQVIEKEIEEPIDLETNSAAKHAVTYLTEIFNAVGIKDFTVLAVKQGDATLFRIDGEEIMDKIETRGETIQAISYLVDRAVNKGVDKKEAQYLRIRLDIAGYRGRRESELVALAEKTGKEVAETKRSKTLAPMNPYERLIVHTTISSIDGIISESIGSDNERRVVIKSTAPDATDGHDWKPQKGNIRYNRGKNTGRKSNKRFTDDKNGSNKKSTAPDREYANKPKNKQVEPIVPDRRDAVMDGEDLPLYGKIEL